MLGSSYSLSLYKFIHLFFFLFGSSKVNVIHIVGYRVRREYGLIQAKMLGSPKFFFLKKKTSTPRHSFIRALLVNGTKY